MIEHLLLIILFCIVSALMIARGRDARVISTGAIAFLELHRQWWPISLARRWFYRHPPIGTWWSAGDGPAAILVHIDHEQVTLVNEHGMVNSLPRRNGTWLQSVWRITDSDCTIAEAALRGAAENRDPGSLWRPNVAAEALDIAFRNRGPWIQLASGHRWYVEDPRPDEFSLSDLGGPVIRFSSHAGIYTTWEHQIRVSRLLAQQGHSAWIQLLGALHDTHESLPPGDMPGPIVRSNSAAGRLLRELEGKARRAVRTRLCLPMSFGPEVKAADMILLATEARDLLPGGPIPGWGPLPEPLAERIVPRPPAELDELRRDWWRLVGRLADEATYAVAMRNDLADHDLLLALEELTTVSRTEASTRRFPVGPGASIPGNRMVGLDANGRAWELGDGPLSERRPANEDGDPTEALDVRALRSSM